jgi:centromere/kinetochore protein ZW10
LTYDTSHRTITGAMDIDTTETKVQIRLTTRDPSLQISEEPNILLVQTCK